MSHVRWLDQVSETEFVYYVSPVPGARATWLVDGSPEITVRAMRA